MTEERREPASGLASSIARLFEERERGSAATVPTVAAPVEAGIVTAGSELEVAPPPTAVEPVADPETTGIERDATTVVLDPNAAEDTVLLDADAAEDVVVLDSDAEQDTVLLAADAQQPTDMLESERAAAPAVIESAAGAHDSAKDPQRVPASNSAGRAAAETPENPPGTSEPSRASSAAAPETLHAAASAEAPPDVSTVTPDVSAETPAALPTIGETAAPKEAGPLLRVEADTQPEVESAPTTAAVPPPSSNGTPVSADAPVELPIEDESPLPLADPFDVPQWAVREVDQRSSLETAAATLEQAVRNYLWGPDPAPTELASRIEELCLRLAGSGELEPVVGAVERLALGTEGPDSTALQLARRILTPQVGNALAAALGASVKDGPRRDRLSAAIVRLGPPMVHTVARMLAESTERTARRAYLDVLSTLGEDALPALRELAGDSRWFVVRNAILLLREHGEPEVSYISAALQHDDPRVRKEALLALAHMGVESAGPLVASKLADPDSDVRKSAAMAAGAVRSSSVVKPLLERLDREGENDVLESILLALGQIGDAAAVPAIEKRSSGGFFQRPHSSVRVAAYRALAAIGTPQARKRVRDAANDRDPVVREAVERLIRGR